MKCQKCQAELDSNVQFCSMCGASVSEESDTSENKEPIKDNNKKSPKELRKGVIISIIIAEIAVIAAVATLIILPKDTPAAEEKSGISVSEISKADENKKESKKSDTEYALNCLYNGMGFLYFYSDYFDDSQSFSYSSEDYVKDPREIFNLGYTKKPAENVNWILKNIMNIEPEAVTEIRAEANESNIPCELYLKDGYYYTGTQFLGDDNFLALSNLTKKQLVGQKYEVSANICISDESGEPQNYIGEVKATVAAKEADGKHFWSIYNYSKTLDYSLAF